MWRLTITGLVVFAASLLGCEGECARIECPNPSIGEVLIPSNLAAPLDTVTSSDLCSVQYQRDNTGMTPGFVGVFLNEVSGTDSRTCQIFGILHNGSQVQAEIRFMYQSLPGCCGDAAFRPVAVATFMSASP